MLRGTYFFFFFFFLQTLTSPGILLDPILKWPKSTLNQLVISLRRPAFHCPLCLCFRTQSLRTGKEHFVSAHPSLVSQPGCPGRPTPGPTTCVINSPTETQEHQPEVQSTVCLQADHRQEEADVALPSNQVNDLSSWKVVLP